MKERISFHRSPLVNVAMLSLVMSCSHVNPSMAQDDVTVDALPSSLSGISDEGVFYLFQNESRLATMTHNWKKDGSFEGTSTLSMAGQNVDSKIVIPATPDGRWRSMTMETSLGTVEVRRDGSVVKVTFRGKTETLALKPDTMLFENFTPAFITQSIRAYDKDKGGKQTVPVFIVPQTVIEMSVEWHESVRRTVGSRDMSFQRYTLAMPGVDIYPWTDDEGRLYLATVPAQHVAYVRKGYESLRLSEDDDPLLSKPTFGIKNVPTQNVAMRDGVHLSTDVYVPDKEAKYPAVLIRTPYKKEMVEIQAQYFARRGYAVAVQDCRGRFESEGIWEPFVNEPKDGYDTIEWMAKQPWSNGKVGMIGASYLGWVQWWAASERPPHLVTIIPNVSPPDPFYNIPYEYGVYFLFGAIWWSDILETEATGDLSGAAMYEIGEKKYTKLLRSLPVIDLDEKVLGKKNPYWRKWIEHNSNDEYWARASFSNRLANVRIPVFHQSGWFDGDGIGSKLNYLKMASHGHPHQKLILGPWGHTPEAHRMVGDRDFGPEAIVDLQRAYLRWFDYWLKGVQNGIADEPLVSLFVMGADKWLHGDTYPLSQTRMQKWYLSSDGKANTSKGSGKLSRTKPAVGAPNDKYRYNPGDPTPSPHYYEAPDDEAYQAKTVVEKRAMAKSFHNDVTEMRGDILVYVTDPLDQPLTFAGPLSAVIYASTSAKDTDWFVRLMEVDDEDEIFILAEGKIRARFRESMSNPVLLTPGEVYAYTIDLWQTGIEIPRGHRLRVEIASASFPLFSRNLNTGGHNEKETNYDLADQVIYHNEEYPSHIVLPVIPD